MNPTIGDVLAVKAYGLEAVLGVMVTKGLLFQYFMRLRIDYVSTSLCEPAFDTLLMRPYVEGSSDTSV